jgi:FtsP/CotA-like multicopper oxidase with cupredoxin domain
LTYNDLRSVEGIISDQRPPGRDIELHLTGNMERYSWSLDGVAFDESTPIHFRYGERLRVIFVNDTMMSHPMHLHGLWSDLESPNGQVQVRKHVVVVQPAQRVSFRVTADARGYWPWHCHLFYHMHGGMFRVVVVA